MNIEHLYLLRHRASCSFATSVAHPHHLGPPQTHHFGHSTEFTHSPHFDASLRPPPNASLRAPMLILLTNSTESDWWAGCHYFIMTWLSHLGVGWGSGDTHKHAGITLEEGGGRPKRCIRGGPKRHPCHVSGCHCRSAVLSVSKVRTFFSVSNSFIEEVMHTLLHAVDLYGYQERLMQVRPSLRHVVQILGGWWLNQLRESAGSWLVCWCRAAQSTDERWSVRWALDAPRRMSVLFLSKKESMKPRQQKRLCDYYSTYWWWFDGEVDAMCWSQSPTIYPKSIQNHPTVCSSRRSSSVTHLNRSPC